MSENGVRIGNVVVSHHIDDTGLHVVSTMEEPEIHEDAPVNGCFVIAVEALAILLLAVLL